MPQKSGRIRLDIHSIRNCHRSPVESVIVATILKFLLDPSADLESIIGGHRHVPGIKETVNVSPKQQSIAHFVCPSLRVWADMRRIQGGQCSLSGHCATPSIGVGDKNAKCALSEPRPNEHGLSVAGLLVPEAG
jgi:hypothetical protein